MDWLANNGSEAARGKGAAENREASRAIVAAGANWYRPNESMK